MAAASKALSFFEYKDEFVRRLSGRVPIMFLDYDGTLTPIVDTPDKAVLSDDMRDMVQRLSDCYTTAVVSGRATDDVRAKVGLPQLMYAGSHGFEIVMPDGHIEINKEAEEIRSIIDGVYEDIARGIKHIPGALVEHVKYTVSVHYRLVDPGDVEKVERVVDDVLLRSSRLRKTNGKKVFEIRPSIDWDKGKAVNWILKTLEADETMCPIYLGDDTTDEDAFKVLQDRGLGVVVKDPARVSAAPFFVNETADIKAVLEFLVRLNDRG